MRMAKNILEIRQKNRTIKTNIDEMMMNRMKVETNLERIKIVRKIMKLYTSSQKTMKLLCAELVLEEGEIE